MPFQSAVVSDLARGRSTGDGERFVEQLAERRLGIEFGGDPLGGVAGEDLANHGDRLRRDFVAGDSQPGP